MIYYIEKTIRGLWGEQAVVVFMTGAGGDVTQVDNRIAYAIKQFGEGNSRLVGGRIGAEAAEGSAVAVGRARLAGAAGGRVESARVQAPRSAARAGGKVPMEIVDRRREAGRSRPSGRLPRRSLLLDWLGSEAADRPGRSASDSGRAGDFPLLPGRILLPVRARHPRRQQVSPR